jgi:hypothetical protein
VAQNTSAALKARRNIAIFHDTLFVGMLYGETPGLFCQTARNSTGIAPVQLTQPIHRPE